MAWNRHEGWESRFVGDTEVYRRGSQGDIKGRRMRNVANRANCGYNTKFRIIPRTTGAIPEKATSLCAAVRRNSTITTITIKSGGVGAMLSRRWRKRRAGRRGCLLQEKRLSAEQRECRKQALEEFSSSRHRLMVYCPSTRRRILGEAKKRAHRCSFRDISQDRSEQSSRRRQPHPAAPFPLREIRSLGV